MKKKSKIMNFKISEEEYDEIKIIAEKLGATLSSMLRIIIKNQLTKYRVKGDPNDFIKK